MNTQAFGRIGRCASVFDRVGTRRLTIRSNVALCGANPYLDLFYDAMAGEAVDYIGSAGLSCRWLKEHSSGTDIIHIHWPEFLFPPSRCRVYAKWRAAEVLAERSARACIQAWKLWTFRAFLQEARKRNIKIVWTVHNTEPHERRSTAQRLAFALLARAADLLICHDEESRNACIRRYRPRCDVILMPHGNYKTAYPPPRPREMVRRELGMCTQQPVLACVGHIRENKGFDLACDALDRMDRVQLLIAGAPTLDFEIRKLRENMNGMRGRVLRSQELSCQEFSDFVNAADLILLPYRAVTGSGALLAALTLGKAVVASDLPFFRSIIGEEPAAGALFRVNDACDMVQCVEAMLRIPEHCRQAAARRVADKYDWNCVVRPVARVIDGWRGIANQSR